MPSLDELEARLRKLLEVEFTSLLPSIQSGEALFHNLSTTMKDHLQPQGNTLFAPNVYVILASPDSVEKLYVIPHLTKKLADALYKAGRELDYSFHSMPLVTITTDTSLGPHDLHIIPSFSSIESGATVGMQGDNRDSDLVLQDRLNAFLIQGGRKIIPITEQALTLGRKLDNQVIIDDPRVSRRHAQVRQTATGCILSDLNSTGGTYVNGKRISQTCLQSGDVISLAGVTFIFGQDRDASATSDGSGTIPNPALSPSTPDQGDLEIGGGQAGNGEQAL